MALSVTHSTVVVTADDGTSDVGTNEWNAAHTLTGTVSPAQGGTGVANSASSTLTISGAFATTLTVSGATGVTLPTSGTLATLAGTEELTGKTLTSSVGKGTWTASGTWTLPAITLGGTVSGGGQQLNNIIIGTSTPLAGAFTTLSATGALTYGGVTLTAAVTGTGKMVLDTSPTIATPVINSVAHVGGAWVADATWTLPAYTLGGTVSGGGNQVNNVIIGTSTPLAGTFTTLAGNTSVQTGVASTTTGSLILAHASSSFLTTITAGNAAAARTYIWPTNFGASGTVLTDAAGNGTLSWATPTAATPTVITVADEASDTTCFPAFFTAATGDLGPKSNAGLTFNSSTGALGSKTHLLTQGTITDSAPQIDGSVTINDATEAFTIWKLNVTNTNSATDTKLMDYQIGSSSKLSITNIPGTGNFAGDLRIKFGTDVCLSYSSAYVALAIMNAACTAASNLKCSGIEAATGTVSGVWQIGDKIYLPDNSADTPGGVRVASDSTIGWSSTTNCTGTVDTYFNRTATGAVKLTTDGATTYGSLQLATLQRNPPVTETNSTHTVAATTTHLIANRAGDITVTLPTASSFPGRELYIKTIQAQTVTSNASNVVPHTSATAGTAILPATDGSWVLLVSDGTNWISMGGSPVV